MHIQFVTHPVRVAQIYGYTVLELRGLRKVNGQGLYLTNNRIYDYMVLWYLKIMNGQALSVVCSDLLVLAFSAVRLR